ncbi:MAG: leucine-rich repeat domain-containing protein [Candidatus Obscuribacterales bacterium]
MESRKDQGIRLSITCQRCGSVLRSSVGDEEGIEGVEIFETCQCLERLRESSAPSPRTKTAEAQDPVENPALEIDASEIILFEPQTDAPLPLPEPPPQAPAPLIDEVRSLPVPRARKVPAPGSIAFVISFAVMSAVLVSHFMTPASKPLPENVDQSDWAGLADFEEVSRLRPDIMPVDKGSITFETPVSAKIQELRAGDMTWWRAYKILNQQITQVARPGVKSLQLVSSELSRGVFFNLDALETVELRDVKVSRDTFATFPDLTSIKNLILVRMPIKDKTNGGSSLEEMDTLKQLAILYPYTQVFSFDFSQMKNLERLELCAPSGMTPETFQSICSLPNLRRLSIKRMPLTEDQVDLLVNDFPGLEYLSLNQSGVTDSMVKKIARLSRLKFLDLTYGAVSDPGAFAGLKSLEYLSLRRNPIGTKDLSAIASLPSLKRLDISETDASDASLESLSRSRLEELSIRELARVTREGIKSLSRIKSLRALDGGLTLAVDGSTHKVVPQLKVLLRKGGALVEDRPVVCEPLRLIELAGGKFVSIDEKVSPGGTLFPPRD